MRKRHPGTGVVVLSQYDDPEYAISLLGEGSAGYAYLLKDRVADGDQLARAIREVATGGSMLDPAIVEALVNPVTSAGDLTAEDEELLQLVAEGRPIKAIAAAQGHHAGGGRRRRREAVPQAGPGGQRGRRQARCGACACSTRPSSTGRSRARRSAGCCPGAWPRSCATEGRRIGETETLDVTVLMSDIRGYSAIAEHADPSVLAGQLNEHRAEMNRAILGEGGTVMQFVGDAVMAVFGAPLPQDDHAAPRGRGRIRHAPGPGRGERALAGARGCPRSGSASACRPVEVAAALLGSEERLEYTLVGDTVNLSQRLQQWAGGRGRPC